MAARNKPSHVRGTISRDVPTARDSGIISPWEAVLRLASWIQRDAELRRSRRVLLDLTDRELRDIGLTREEARREGRRSLYLD